MAFRDHNLIFRSFEARAQDRALIGIITMCDIIVTGSESISSVSDDKYARREETIMRGPAQI